MRLKFHQWKYVPKLIKDIDKPTSTNFFVTIHTEWEDGKLVFLVDIPQEYLV